MMVIATHPPHQHKKLANEQGSSQKAARRQLVLKGKRIKVLEDRVDLMQSKIIVDADKGTKAEMTIELMQRMLAMQVKDYNDSLDEYRNKYGLKKQESEVSG